MRYSIYLPFAVYLSALNVLATPGEGVPAIPKIAHGALRRSGSHQNLARQSRGENWMTLDEPSIFERSLDSEVEEEERRKLAQEEGWYGESDSESGEGLNGDSEDLDNIWDEKDEDEAQGSKDYNELYKRAPSNIRRIRRTAVSSPLSKKGLVGYKDKRSGPSGATTTISTRSGPNGSQAWLNHGISKIKRWSRWTPPQLKLSQLKTVSLTKALKDPASPFHACKPYIKLFNSAAKKYNLPPILLASIAMQESSCQPSASGDDNGAFGLMQLIVENCKGRSGSDCAEPEFK
ncbi:MAG: hypothetical protein CYPHOPRED_003424 [Cyphobasidiales sp. Tagirdzhanova-0007]|nr:MAG: hypothetical protein CYPHOPRED_003424 [Cyphobasidiales sp. Tagirdzhanova-0007]